MKMNRSSYLKELESESLYIIREAVSGFSRPVMLYSVGKDSSVLLRLARKAFYPGKIPFPLMHIDTGYKFPEMYTFRDEIISETGARLIVERNNRIEETIDPETAGRDRCCALLKTDGLLGALKKHGFNGALAGARRDEEKSRAKERIFSLRDIYGQWDPKNQRPELWNIYNTGINEGESARIFPLSNWTEIDIWRYIKWENIPVVSLYFAREREVALLNNIIIPVEHLKSYKAEKKHTKTKTVKCRYRSLGCIPCTGAVESDADTIDKIIHEVESAGKSERENRIIDLTGDSSMEEKKRSGYF
jgi:sulfate adenylyltransferase subunit 2